MRPRSELEAGPLDMTEDEVDAYFPEAREQLEEIAKEWTWLGASVAPRQFQCDNRDLHVTVVIDEEADRYAMFSWRPDRRSWKFSF